jgi:hypothetical protein
MADFIKVFVMVVSFVSAFSRCNDWQAMRTYSKVSLEVAGVDY